ncbi:Z1 domain-containing protein [Delftia tsuruhatensis]|uniref:Z1 domain-containing protein n=1 Tax=Delftia tsuruhatensis TaxID=180282 RepID=UPI002090FD6A|nr:Z1 domain-containing protein [Delftia tsuruhatensis]MCO5335735.1 Z1 domain-containing protein [Delftia tsuruhatensis]MCR4544296.1 Z1 domain-containing protein [Delftia tsuruhatensis]
MQARLPYPLTLKPRLALWTDGTVWTNWSRHEACLRSQPKWKPHQIASVAEESLRIISKTTPIARPEFQCRGLVVGYVQSGKTANFTAVAARAADVGYRLIIVLSGIHDSLRNQTQKRLDLELTRTGVDWITLTDETSDFREPEIADGFASTGTVLIVAKKITPILKRLNQWFGKLEGRLADVPVLLIDDEADQASINTRGNRRDPSIDTDAEPDDDTAPSLTNALIRDILRKIPRATYIAYTATPFANILIDPDASDHQVGEDLFPKDFVVQLPRPDGYTGTEELFGISAQGRDILRPVDPADVKALKSKQRKRSEAIVVQAPLDLPQSLADAILTFALVGAVRLLRGQSGKPNTMLVHVSQFQQDQLRIGEAIEEQIRNWFHHESAEPGVLKQMFRSTLAGLGPVNLPCSEEDLLEEAVTNLARLVVVVLNSTTGDELEYEAKPGRQLVAVGGNRLSRGLTLEGLTISYFLRTTTLADALLQMARWYGFRTGYEDLIRIWTTEGIAQWFVELALVEESLRDSITALNKASRRPDQMAIRMRAHSKLLLTSKNKSRMQTDDARSWSGENPQTILFPMQDREMLERNVDLASALLRQHPPTQDAHGGSIAHDVPPEDIALFLQRYEGHPNSIAFQGAEIANWILERAEKGELTNWTVFVANPQRERKVLLGGRPFGLVRRSLQTNESIGILIDPRHEGVDLHGGPENYRAASGFNARAMREDRPAQQGLLLLYPLDPEPLRAPTQAVLGLALSLPRTTDGEQRFVVNRGIRHG